MPPARRQEKKIPIVWSFIDYPVHAIVEPVWVDDAIKYLVYNWLSGEHTLQEKYVSSYLRREMVPPSKDNELLIKANPILLPHYQAPFEEKMRDFNQARLDERLKAFIGEYLVLNDEIINMLSAYVKFTWVHERSEVKPYLNIWGDKGTGKSSIAEVALEYICRHSSYAAGGITASSLLRHSDAVFGTQIMDEVEWMQSEEGEKIRAILRGGYKDTGTYMLSEATGGGSFQPKIFNTGCPKIIIGRQPIQDSALRSRCLEIELKPVEVPSEKKRHTEKWFQIMRTEQAQTLVDDLIWYRLRELPQRYERSGELSVFESRLSDTAQPLIYCLHNPNDRRMYLDFINKNVSEILAERLESMEGKILLLISENIALTVVDPSLLVLTGDRVRIPIKMLIDQYKERFEPDTDEHMFNKFLNPYKLGRRLLGMGIRTKRSTGGVTIIDNDCFPLLPELYRRYGVDRLWNESKPNLERGGIPFAEQDEQMSLLPPDEEAKKTKELSDEL